MPVLGALVIIGWVLIWAKVLDVIWAGLGEYIIYCMFEVEEALHGS